MVVWSSPPERRSSSSARRSVVARLAAIGVRGVVDAYIVIDVCTAYGAYASIGVHECADDGSGVPPEGLPRHPL
jgi:hypothetical protein